MQFFLNLILLIVTLVYLVVSYQIYFTRMPAGDGGVGWSWQIIQSYLILLVLMTILTLIISLKGAYSWINNQTGNKVVYALLGTIIIVLGAGLASFTKGEPSFTPGLINKGITVLSTFIPIIFILCSFFLVNKHWIPFSPTTLKIPLFGSVIIGFASILLFVVNLYLESINNQKNRVNSILERQDANDIRMIQAVEAANILNDVDFLNILVYADDNKDTSVVNKAVARIKSRTDWQETMVKNLSSGGAMEVFNFLASHDADNKEIFPDAVNKGLYSVADWIRSRIKEGSQEHHFYAAQYGWEVERALRSADRFQHMGVDFIPAAQEIKKALLQPHQIKRKPFNCISYVDRWIEKNKK